MEQIIRVCASDILGTVFVDWELAIEFNKKIIRSSELALCGLCGSPDNLFVKKLYDDD